MRGREKVTELESKKKKSNGLKEQVNSLYGLMKSENLEELEVKDEGFYVSLKRKSKYKEQPIIMPARPAVQAQVAAPAEAPKAVEIKGETIKSPIIGTFYRSPSPTSPTFVKDGDMVDAGKTLCIVEAMKVMNEIKAESRYKILKILVENGKPVTSGQDLFLIEK
jgi:acetyl-CoA carboxylase biotin carboxyl carrier protein